MLQVQASEEVRFYCRTDSITKEHVKTRILNVFGRFLKMIWSIWLYSGSVSDSEHCWKSNSRNMYYYLNCKYYTYNKQRSKYITLYLCLFFFVWNKCFLYSDVVSTITPNKPLSKIIFHLLTVIPSFSFYINFFFSGYITIRDCYYLLLDRCYSRLRWYICSSFKARNGVLQLIPHD